MTFAWPLGKIDVINSALSQTGDNLVSVADDGSVEWGVCSPAYETALAVVSEDHPWSWLTDMRILQPAVNAPDDDRFDTAYNLPDDLVHLILVRVADRPTVWGLLNNQLVVNAQGGPPPPPAGTVVPAVVAIKGIFSTNADPTFATPLVVLVLQMFVMAGIYRGMRRDTAEAARLSTAAMAMLEKAKTRHDQQNPRTRLFRSRMMRARRVSRLGGFGWGG